MLEKLPSFLGKALRAARSGFDKIVSEAEFATVAQSIDLQSSAFEEGASIPPRFTADGEELSPPLHWRGVPAQAEGLVLIVEDPDAPAARPLVHLLAWDLPADLEILPEGELASPGHEGLDENLGRNSYLQTAWLPPDPPSGHGPHLYCFQLFALDRRLDFTEVTGSEAVIEQMRGHVLAKGLLTGTYERT